MSENKIPVTMDDLNRLVAAMKGTINAVMELTWLETFSENAFVKNDSGKTVLAAFTDTQLSDIAAILTDFVANVDLADLQTV